MTENRHTTNSQQKPAWVDGRTVPYVIAEAGVNHNGKIDLALQLVDAAREAGANCVKFQTYTADELVVQTAAKAPYQQTCGHPGETQYEMLKRYELQADAFATIKAHCGETGIDFLVTPFSPSWVTALVKIGVQAFKIGSGNLQDLTLLHAIGQTHLPVILSTGMADLKAVEFALRELQWSGCAECAVLHCVSLYPTELEQTNLQAIRRLKEVTAGPVGFSDHTLEVETGALAVTAGAVILEKHLTLDRTLEGPDHAMSLEPTELGQYIAWAQRAHRACGSGVKAPLEQELTIKAAVGMSVVAQQFIPAGNTITRDMLTTKRPGTGYTPDKIEIVVGSAAIVDIQPDQVIMPEHVKQIRAGQE